MCPFENESRVNFYKPLPLCLLKPSLTKLKCNEKENLIIQISLNFLFVVLLLLNYFGEMHSKYYS